MHSDLFITRCAGSLELPHRQPATAGDTPHWQDCRDARTWVCTHGPEIESLISRMFSAAPDLQYVIDIDPAASLPTLSVTLWCKRTQLFRFDARLARTDSGWQTQVSTRLGAGPVLPSATLALRTGSSSDPGLTSEDIVAVFRRALRLALTRDPHTAIQNVVSS